MVVGVHTAITHLIRTMGHHCWKELEGVKPVIRQKKSVFMDKVVSVVAAEVAEQEVLSHTHTHFVTKYIANKTYYI